MIKQITLIITLAISGTFSVNGQKTTPSHIDYLKLKNFFNATNGINWIRSGKWLTGEFRYWYGITTNYCPTCLDDTTYAVETLNLPKNNLIGTLTTDFNDMIQLSEVDLSHNSLHGSITPSLSNYSIDHLDLSYNQLSGIIPIQLFQSEEIAWLDLSHNQLSDTLPADMANMEEIEHLDLSHNKLTGFIPASIVRLKDNYEPLVSLDISYNRFNFDGMELLAQELPFAIYAPQDFIPINFINCKISVSAGGTLANNTYTWYRDGIWETTKIGDFSFTPTIAGRYRVVITNSVAKALILYSEDISFNTVTWSGAEGNTWENPKNWVCLILPDSTKDVVIFGGGVIAFLNSNAEVASLSVKSGAILTLEPKATLKIYGPPIGTVLMLDVKDGRSWTMGDTTLAPAIQTTVKLYYTLEDVTNNNPAYTLVANKFGLYQCLMTYIGKFYIIAQRGTNSNVYNGYLVKGIFLTQDEVNMAPVQSPAAVIGGVRLTDINNDGVINLQDKIPVDSVDLIYNATVNKTIVIY